MIIQFLDSLPATFASTRDIHSATGAAMLAALKLLVCHTVNLLAAFHLHVIVMSSKGPVIIYDRGGAEEKMVG